MADAPESVDLSFYVDPVSLIASWQAVAGADSYNVYLNEVFVGNTVDTHYEFYDLSDGEYTVGVASMEGQSGSSVTTSPSKIADGTAPTLSSATVNETGTAIVLVFVEGGSPPIQNSPDAHTGFSVTVDDETAAITSGSIDNLTLTLNLASVVQQNQTVKVSYDGGGLGDSAGGGVYTNAVDPFTDYDVTNQSTVEPEPPVATVEDVVESCEDFALGL